MSHHMLSGARPRALAVAVTLACLTPAAMAAGRQDMHAANLAQLQAHYSSLVATKGVSSMAHTRHEQLIGADAETRLVLTYRDTSHGVRNTRYQQTFRGIPVYGESIVVSEDAASGKLRTLFGRQVTGLAAEIADRAQSVQADLGWTLHPDHTGHGYATEAVRAVLRICFEDLGLRRVTADCFTANEPSWRLMERLGMRRETHTIREALHRSGEWLDGYAYALLADEWRPTGI